MAAATAAAIVIGVVGAGVGLIAGAGCVDLFEGGLKLGAGVGEVLQKLGLTSELDDEGLVFGCLEHLVEKDAAGSALVVDDVALTEAGVDEQAKGEGEIGVDVEVADGLRMSVDLEDEVILGEGLDERAFFVADDDRKVHEACIDSDGREAGGGLCCRGILGDERNCEGKKQSGDKGPEGTKVFHVSLDEIGWWLFQWQRGRKCILLLWGSPPRFQFSREIEMESSALARRYREFSAAYLVLILIAMIGIGLHATGTMTQWILGDWLINYQGGFVRRGLTGQIIFLLSQWLHVSPLMVAVAVALVAYVAVYWSIWKLLENSSWELWVLAAFISPALLGFTVAARGGFHKDVLYLASLALLLVMLMSKDVKDRVVTVYLTLACSFCILSHEPLFVYLPYVLAALVIGIEGLRRAARIALIPMIFAVVSFGAVAMHHGSHETVAAICNSLGKENAPVCVGSVENLSHSSEYARQETVDAITEFHYYLIYPPLALVALIPIAMGFVDLWRTPGLRRDLKLLAGTAAISFVMSLTLFYYATDWGRWIYMHLFSLFLILLFLDHRRQTAISTAEPVRGIAGGRAQVALVTVLLFVYATCWNMPNFSDKPVSGYLGLACRVVRTHSLTASGGSKTP